MPMLKSLSVWMSKDVIYKVIRQKLLNTVQLCAFNRIISNLGGRAFMASTLAKTENDRNSVRYWIQTSHTVVPTRLTAWLSLRVAVAKRGIDMGKVTILHERHHRCKLGVATNYCDYKLPWMIQPIFMAFCAQLILWLYFVYELHTIRASLPSSEHFEHLFNCSSSRHTHP